ncbi:putative steroid dehydrogenase [Hypoxylon fragiforme]|uniref:putative steroid dehydrogenase n=1 Tax=Hypoxylon fragiforme TaxID=63214 RepID=UPI0020C658D8|nr:putative steroid dehydrogenase [Hypoxylon fragiforme]KAI2608564.1 putative steroid dehydrogenase [Hypoxylon fragiforme]
MSSFSALWTQFFPPRNGAPLTESNLPSQAGRVFIVTGGSSGLGFELTRILYHAGGKVYVLTRSKEHAEDAFTRIQSSQSKRRENAPEQDATNTQGSLEFIHMDLTDFTTIKTAACEFLEREGPDGRLDVLFNNAGTGAVKDAPPTRQGLEYHFAVNSLGPYLLTQLLIPILSSTVRKSPQDSVRVVWPASCLVDLGSPKTGIRKEFLQNTESVKDQNELYSTSKTATWFVASEFARRQANTGIVQIAGNPGNYITNIWRSTSRLLYYVLWPILRDPVHGAETYLWMGFSQSVTMDDAVAGRYAICDGRWHPGQREDLLLALRSVEEGGSGRAAEYFDWCAEKVRDFLQ